jgi:hypothetical protein
VGLFEALPVPGDPFPVEQRQRWLAMLELAFDYVYGPTELVWSCLPDRNVEPLHAGGGGSWLRSPTFSAASLTRR